MEKREEDAKTGCSEVASKIPFVNIPRKLENTAWGIFRTAEASHVSSDASLFSSSLPVLPHEKCMPKLLIGAFLGTFTRNKRHIATLCYNMKRNDALWSLKDENPTFVMILAKPVNFPDLEHLHQSVDDSLPNLIKVDQEFETKDPLEDTESNSFRITLPDDEDELLAGLTDDFDLTRLPSHLEEMEEYDFFGSGGRMELDFESQDRLGINLSKLSLSDGVSPNGISQYVVLNGAATVVGEHPYGEHPSRTLFVRNINRNVEDSELRSLFEQYGHIKTLYTACKHRGFVMISYYDIRSARDAMRALQNKPLRRRKLDIHFSIPKDNPSEKDINQGSLVVFNLDASVSNDELRLVLHILLLSQH